MKLVLAFSLAVFMLVSLGSCRKEEQKPMVQAQQTFQGHGVSVAKLETKVIVPAKVKTRWLAIKITVEDKVEGTKQEFTSRPNTEMNIPDSNLKVFIGDFLPAFTMDAGTITSSSADPNNPAVGIRVIEGAKQIFPAPDKQWGWLFAKFPAIHAFEHQKYGITLKEGIEKKS